MWLSKTQRWIGFDLILQGSSIGLSYLWLWPSHWLVSYNENWKQNIPAMLVKVIVVLVKDYG